MLDTRGREHTHFFLPTRCETMEPEEGQKSPMLSSHRSGTEGVSTEPWMKHIGMLSFRTDLERIDWIIEEQFDKIDPEKWELKEPGVIPDSSLTTIWRNCGPPFKPSHFANSFSVRGAIDHLFAFPIAREPSELWSHPHAAPRARRDSHGHRLVRRTMARVSMGN